MDVDLNDHGGDQSDDTNGDGEGVWSPDIEQCFREALLLFPPCGRRKHILQEEGGGKMYGRNELIARHIMMRTGKSRTRKQVSSHIQVLARRKAKAEAASVGGVAIARSPSVARSQSADQNQRASSVGGGGGGCYYDVWADRPIVSQKIRLVEFSAFIEYLSFQSNVATVVPSTTTTHHIGPQPISGVMSTQDLCENMQQASLGPQQPPALQQQHLQSYATGGPNVVQANPATTTTASTNATHPLASNHHLPAQFNQANSYGIVGIKMENQKLLENSQTCVASGGLGSQQQLHQMPLTSSANYTRHSYVQIDYRKTLGRQPNKLERIDISQIQDKFPEIGGSDGLFQRGPSDAFFLIKFWADLTNDYEYNIDDQNSYFGFSSHFETIHFYKDITCSTKACSYGLQVVEKVEKIYGALNSSNGRYSYDINRSPMCEFMIKFIKKLRQLPRASQMNSVLENFTVLQVITSESTSEILLCLAYVFEVDQSNGSQYNVYKLTKD